MGLRVCLKKAPHSSGSISGTVKSVNVEIGASTSISDSIGLHSGKFDIRNTTSAQAGLGIANIIDWNYS